MARNRYKSQDKLRKAAHGREGERLRFSRNQAIGVLLLALVFLMYRLLRTPSGWLLPHGWWRW